MKFNSAHCFRLLTSIGLVLGSIHVQIATAADYSALVAAASKIEPGQSLEAFQQLENLRLAATNQVARRDLESALVQLLKPESTFLARRFACKQLGIVGSGESVPALAALLSSEETVGIACLAFTTYPPGKADDALRSAVSGAAPGAKVQLLQVLGDRRDPKAVKLFAAAALDANRGVAEAAIAGLGKSGSSAAVKELEALRKNPTAPHRVVLEAILNASQARLASGDRKGAAQLNESLLDPDEELAIRRAAFDGLTRSDKDGGLARILALLKSDDRALRPNAIAAVGRLTLPTASSAAFAALLPALSPDEQAWLIDSLAVIGDKPALAAAKQSLQSQSAVVRQAAIPAVAKLAGGDAVEPLVGVLKSSPSPEEAKLIEAALVSLPAGKLLDQSITKELERSEGTVRAQLLIVINRRQGAAATPLLLAEADNTNAIVAKTAFRRLALSAGTADVPATMSKLLRPLAPEVRHEAEVTVAALLGKIRQPSLRSHAARDAMSRADTSENKISILNLLPACGDEDALASAREMMSDPDPAVVTAAIESLSEWPDAGAWNLLAGVYFTPGDETRRTLALKGLVRLLSEGNARADEEILGRYAKLLEAARNDADRRQVLGALGGATHPGALPLAQAQLTREPVRAEAEAAVRRIATAIKASQPQAAEAALKALPPK